MAQGISFTRREYSIYPGKKVVWNLKDRKILMAYKVLIQNPFLLDAWKRGVLFVFGKLPVSLEEDKYIHFVACFI